MLNRLGFGPAPGDLDRVLVVGISAYIEQQGLRGRYLHSEIDTLERVEIINELRRGSYDVLVESDVQVAA